MRIAVASALAGAGALVLIGAPAALAQPAPQPPDLQRLEQAMLALQVGSERFAATIEIGGSAADAALGPLGGFAGGRLAHLAALAPLANAVGEIAYSPRAASYES